MQEGWDRGVDYFSYLQEKLSRRQWFEQQMKFMTLNPGIFN